MKRIVVYTAIFGGYDKLLEPEVLPEGIDFVCFTDKDIRSKNWQVRTVEPAYKDATRNARMYKVLPHRYLGGYDVSIWIDGNVLVRGDVSEAIRKYLGSADIAMYDHAFAKHRDKERSPDIRRSLYEEAELLVSMAERGRVKDDLDIIKAHIERYKNEGYKADNKTPLTTIVFRRHNAEDVKKAMETWWQEIKNGSKRDQLSFSYVAWTEKLNVAYIEDNARENDYFLVMAHGK